MKYRKLKYRLLYKYKWLRKLQHWYQLTFHRKRTLENFRKFLEELEDIKDD